MNRESTHQAIDHAADAAERASQRALSAAERGLTAVRETSQQMRDRAERARESAVGYVRHEPMKSVLIAAAAGAVIVALMNLMTRSRY